MAKKTIEELVQWFDDYEDASQSARELSERDRDFYDGKQWTTDEEAELEKRGQATSVFNRIAPKIDFILGMEAQTRTAAKAVPRTPSEEGGAESVTDAVRFVCDLNNWNQERSDCGEDLFVEGTCGIDIRIEKDIVNGGDKVILERIPWDRLFWDPRSRFHDFRDAKYYGTVVWMDLDDAMETWPDGEEALSELHHGEQGTINDTFDDRPRFGVWSDSVGGRPRVKVALIWYHVGLDWYVATYTKAGFLEKPRLSPYLDESLLSAPGLLLQSAKVDRNNDRYGLVRPLISPQEEINKRRSKSLHLLNMRQVIAESGAVEDRDLARSELAKPDGYIEVRPEAKFDIIPTGDMTSGHFQLLQEAKSEIDSIGANAALTGKDPRTQSGRAIQARQQGGAIELARLFDRFRAWQLRVYRSSWMRIRQFWNEERWIRVTDNEENTKYVGLNRPIRLQEVMQYKGIEIPPPEQMPPQMAEKLQQVVGIANDMATLDVDIKLDESPDFLSLQDEQFEQLGNLLGSIGSALPPHTIQAMVRMMVSASGLRNKKSLVESLDSGGTTPEQQQQVAQQQQMAQQFQIQNAQLDLQKKEADITKTKSSAFKDQAQGRQMLSEATMAEAEAKLRSLGFTNDE